MMVTRPINQQKHLSSPIHNVKGGHFLILNFPNGFPIGLWLNFFVRLPIYLSHFKKNRKGKVSVVPMTTENCSCDKKTKFGNQ